VVAAARVHVTVVAAAGMVVVAVVVDADDRNDDDGAAVVVFVVAVLVVPVILVVDDACSLKENSWNNSRQLFLVVVGVDHIRIHLNVVEMLRKRFVLAFVDADDAVHTTLHHC
jgi:hypothetical protein